jgi:hypothetical protein
MRIYLIVATSLIILASCSTSKHTYRDFNTTSSSKLGNTSSKSQRSVDNSPLAAHSLQYVASIDHTAPSLFNIKAFTVKESTSKTETKATAAVVLSRTDSVRRFKEISKAQRKEFRKAMRHSMRRYVVPASKKTAKRNELDS